MKIEEYLLQLREDLKQDTSQLIKTSVGVRLDASQQLYQDELQKIYRYIMLRGNVHALKTLIVVTKYEKKQQEEKSNKKNTKREVNDYGDTEEY